MAIPGGNSINAGVLAHVVIAPSLAVNCNPCDRQGRLRYTTDLGLVAGIAGGARPAGFVYTRKGSRAHDDPATGLKIGAGGFEAAQLAQVNFECFILAGDVIGKIDPSKTHISNHDTAPEFSSHKNLRGPRLFLR